LPGPLGKCKNVPDEEKRLGSLFIFMGFADQTTSRARGSAQRRRAQKTAPRKWPGDRAVMVHAIVDALGNPMAIRLTGGQSTKSRN
jgi:hypothetical protein